MEGVKHFIINTREMIRTRFRQKIEKPESEPYDPLNDLRRVGPTKPMGNLPLDTIVNFSKVDPDILIREAENRGLKAKLFDPNKIHGAGLYVYDEKALEALLQRHKLILRIARWPMTAEGFVNYVHSHSAFPYTPLFDVVADSFADYRNGWRLWPGSPPKDLPK
jgi:hypothetical protein